MNAIVILLIGELITHIRFLERVVNCKQIAQTTQTPSILRLQVFYPIDSSRCQAALCNLYELDEIIVNILLAK